MSERRCPHCHAVYPAPARFCSQDGTLLVESPPPPDATRGLRHDHLKQFATLSGRMLDQRYMVGPRLGEGGMSYVYRAIEKGTDRAVAVKILLPRLSLDPRAVERLRREAAMATRLNHPNVCPILRLGETGDGILYLVMPFLEGEPLSEWESRRGPLPLAEGIPLLTQVCRGLQHAHDQQIVHRDLKPENVMLVPQAGGEPGASPVRAVVMDFGLAKERRAGPQLAKLTATGVVLGTPEFMSPEQIRGKPLDGRSDVFALGVLAFEMFTTEIPFPGKSAQETMIARLQGSPLSLLDLRPDLPAQLETVIKKALAIDPAARFQSMDEMASALQEVTAEGPARKLFRRR